MSDFYWNRMIILRRDSYIKSTSWNWPFKDLESHSLIEIVLLSSPIFWVPAYVREWVDTLLNISTFGKSVRRSCLPFYNKLHTMQSNSNIKADHLSRDSQPLNSQTKSKDTMLNISMFGKSTKRYCLVFWDKPHTMQSNSSIKADRLSRDGH